MTRLQYAMFARNEQDELHGRVVGPNFSYETKNKQKMFPDSSYYKKYNGSCFMYLCEILSKLQVFKVRDFMTFSDGLLIMCNFAYKPHTFIFFLFSPGHNH